MVERVASGARRAWCCIGPSESFSVKRTRTHATNVLCAYVCGLCKCNVCEVVCATLREARIAGTIARSLHTPYLSRTHRLTFYALSHTFIHSILHDIYDQ